MFSFISRHLLKPVVPIIRLRGDIDIRSTYLVRRSLRKVNPSRSKALGIVIDSDRGTPAQCEIIITTIQAYCREHKIPLYTFADNRATSIGYWMLCAGDKVFADKASAVGGVGANISHLNVRKLVEDQGIQVRVFESDHKKIIPTKYQCVESADKDAMQSWVNNVRRTIIKYIEKHRGGKIAMEKGKREDEMYQGQLWTGQEGVKYGLVDEIGTFASVLFKEFPKARIVDVSQQPTIEVYKGYFREAIKLLSSQILPFFVLYLLLKNLLKLYVIKLAMKKKEEDSDNKTSSDEQTLHPILSVEDKVSRA